LPLAKIVCSLLKFQFYFDAEIKIELKEQKESANIEASQLKKNQTLFILEVFIFLILLHFTMSLDIWSLDLPA
jgi:hypothetical protein